MINSMSKLKYMMRYEGMSRNSKNKKMQIFY